jgi:hypothetical protein
MPLPGNVDPGNRGYPVTLNFPPNARVASTSLTVYRVDRKGARHEVKGFSFGPDRAIPSDGSTYAYAYRNNSGLCHFIAASPLPVDTRFEALARWTEDGREQERRWWFTTGRRTDTPLD